MDVSQWDGVVGLPSGPSQPFYRMVPDDGDCHSLLGGPRGVRYVAQVIATDCDDGDCHSLLGGPRGVRNVAQVIATDCITE